MSKWIKAEVTIEKYIALWNEHIEDLNGLMWNLTPEQISELKTLKMQLNDLVLKASENVKKERQERDDEGDQK